MAEAKTIRYKTNDPQTHVALLVKEEYIEVLNEEEINVGDTIILESSLGMRPGGNREIEILVEEISESREAKGNWKPIGKTPNFYRIAR